VKITEISAKITDFLIENKTRKAPKYAAINITTTPLHIQNVYLFTHINIKAGRLDNITLMCRKNLSSIYGYYVEEFRTWRQT